MEELKITAHARLYLGNMAKGADPTGGQPLPGDRLLNRKDMRELFDLTARLLQAEIDRAQGRPAAPISRERCAWAVEQMDRLARGEDPVDGGPIPEDCVMKQEWMPRCFRYTAQVLQRRLDREKAAGMGRGVVYALPPEEVRRRTACPQEPLGMRAFLTPVGVLLGFTGAGRGQAFASAATAWMLQEGFLAAQEHPGREAGKMNVPTPRGEAAGLLKVERVNERDGSSFVATVLSEQGQRFLLDSLEQILDFGRARWEAVAACLTPEFTAGIPCLPETVPPTSFLNHVNSLLPPELPTRFAAADVNAWLAKQGLIEAVFIKERRTWRATSAGEAVGFVTQHEKKLALPKGVVLSPAGQQFVLAHLRDTARDLGSGKGYQLIPVEFPVTEELLGKFSYPRGALTISGASQWMNAVLEPETGVRLPEGLLAKWMEEKGFLGRAERPGADRNMGRTILVPTERGEALGLSVNQNHEGDVSFVLYEEAALRYMVEHLEEIVSHWRLC